MHSRLLQDALSVFAEDAAGALQGELAAGAEIPFELVGSGSRRGGSGLLMYRSLTASFVRERWRWLERLDSHERALRALEACHGLERYVAARGDRLFSPLGTRGASHRRSLALAALRAFTEELFDERSDFAVEPARLRQAISALDAASAAEGASLTLVATLDGVSILSPELPLAEGLTLAQPQAIADLPAELRGEPAPADASACAAANQSTRRAGASPPQARAGASPPQARVDAFPPQTDGASSRLVIVYSAGESEEDPSAAIARGRRVLLDLLTALRLFGDGRVALGPVAWAKLDGGPFRPTPLAAPASPPRHCLLVTPEQEDELRAFCSLVARRMPDGDAIAWALRRYELGCARASAYDGLSDHLLALQALLDPSRSAAGLLASRLAALCAPGDQRRRTADRVLEAIELEREAAAGEAVEHAGGLELAHELERWLKALLSDVICGHLDRALDRLADELLLAGEQTPSVAAAGSAKPTREPAVRADVEDAGESDGGETIEVAAVEDPLDALAQGVLPL